MRAEAFMLVTPRCCRKRPPIDLGVMLLAGSTSASDQIGRRKRPAFGK
jgi:hypothetical protein